MAVPFGFSVGDFIAVGKLIAQIVDELRELRTCFGLLVFIAVFL